MIHMLRALTRGSLPILGVTLSLKRCQNVHCLRAAFEMFNQYTYFQRKEVRFRKLNTGRTRPWHLRVRPGRRGYSWYLQEGRQLDKRTSMR